MALSNDEIRELIEKLKKTDRTALASDQKARSVVSHAIANGSLVNPNECEDCGVTNRPIQAHHEDYNKPLEVTWLCKLCHVARHTKPNLSASIKIVRQIQNKSPLKGGESNGSES